MAKNDVVRAVRELPRKKESKEEQIRRIMEERDARTPRLGRPDPSHTPVDEQRVSLPEYLASKLPTGASRDAARMAVHGVARTGNMILRTLDLPNRVFGNSRSLLQDMYERSEANMARDGYEDMSGAPQVGETAVHLATAGVFGKALPAVFGANTGADTYEIAKYSGAPEGEAVMKGVGHGVLDTAIWTLGQGLTSKYLPKSWQWLGRELTGAGRGAASSVTSDAVLNSLGADISGEEMAKRAVHAAWMVPLLGMLKMGGKRREEAMSLLRKARPDLAGGRADKVIETIEAEFADPKSQKVALAWVARKGANLPDDTAQIKQALEVSSKVKGLDPMSKSPFEILSDPAYARYLPKPRPQDVKAFSNMKRYPEGVIGFDVSDDAAGRQATREMINAYMSPSSNPWCLATGKDAAKLGGLGPGAEGYWKSHSAVPKQIFFQEVDGKLELTAFRATSPGGEGRQEYWDTSDAGYSGIPIKKKIPGDPLGRYRKMVFKPGKNVKTAVIDWGSGPESYTADELRGQIDAVQRYELEQLDRPDASEVLRTFGLDLQSERADAEERLQRLREALTSLEPASNPGAPGEVQGTFEDIAPGKVFKGDPFRDGRSQTWAKTEPKTNSYTIRTEGDIYRLIDRGIFPVARRGDLYRALQNSLSNGEFLTVQGSPVSEGVGDYVLVEDKVRTTKNGITRFRTTKYADPTNGDYEPPEPGGQPKPVEIEESELVSPEWMRSRGYDPESESDVRRMQQKLGIQGWGNGMEAAMAVVPTKRTYMQTKSGTPETVTYGPNGRDIMSVDFTKDGVPYREEFFSANPTYDVLSSDSFSIRNAKDLFLFPMSETRVYQELGGDPEPDWTSRPDTLAGEGYRLIQHPGTGDSKLLDEFKWDEGLGGFVRTSGNRRWRTNPNYGGGEATVFVEAPTGAFSIDIDSARENLAAFRKQLPLYRERPEDFRPGALHDMEQLVAAYERAIAGRDPDAASYLVEDLQPDGTWAPAMDTMPDGTSLPPPPPAVRQADTNPNYGRRFNTGDDVDGDVPFALKAGRTRRNVRAAEGGGDASGVPGASVPPSTPVQSGGPRIVINPQVFGDKRDALCVAFNEAFRLVMEENGFEPVSEPTEAQRKFFSDTAYADDELQLRRTILARIATLDTSVKDPTDEQLEETAEMLEMVMEVGAPQNEWEQSAVQRLHDMVVRMRESPRSPAPAERPEETGSAQAAEGAGVTMTGSELDFLRRRYESGASMNARQRALVEAADAQGVERGRSGFVKFSLDPPENAQAAQPVQPVQPAAQPAAQPAQQPQEPAVKVTATGGGMVDWNGNPTSGAGMRVPNKDELAFLRRRRDSGASLSAQQRRILELTDGNDLA